MANEKKMTKAEIMAAAKMEVLTDLQNGKSLADMNVEMVGITPYVPRTVSGQEVWVEIKLTSKQYTDSKVSKAFDPFTARAEYEENLAIKKAEDEANAKIREERKKAKKSRSRANTEE